MWLSVRIMVLNVIFNNISFTSWRSVLLLKDHRPVANRWQSLSHNVVSSIPRLSGFRTHNVGGDSTLTNDLIKTCTTKYTCSKGHNMFEQSVNTSLCIYGPCNREIWSFVYPQKSYYKGHKLFIIPKLHTQQHIF